MYFVVTLRIHMQVLPHAQLQSCEFGCVGIIFGCDILQCTVPEAHFKLCFVQQCLKIFMI